MFFFPNTSWTLSGEEYSGLTWLDSTPKPTEDELKTLWPQAKKEYSIKNIKQARQEAYQKESDPIFFQWQRGEAEEQDWKNAVKLIEERYPYPEENK